MHCSSYSANDSIASRGDSKRLSVSADHV